MSLIHKEALRTKKTVSNDCMNKTNRRYKLSRRWKSRKSTANTLSNQRSTKSPKLLLRTTDKTYFLKIWVIQRRRKSSDKRRSNTYNSKMTNAHSSPKRSPTSMKMFLELSKAMRAKSSQKIWKEDWKRNNKGLQLNEDNVNFRSSISVLLSQRLMPELWIITKRLS